MNRFPAQPVGWKSKPIWALARSREIVGRPKLPLLSMNAVHGLRIRDVTTGRAPSEDLSGYRAVEIGDLVVNKLSARDGALAVSGYRGIVSPAYWVLGLDASIAEPQFVHHLLHSSPYRSEIARLSKFMPPAQFDLPWQQFRSLSLVLPPLAEQRRIADFLDDQVALLDRAIELRQQQMTLMGERFGSELNSFYEPGVDGATATPLVRLLLQGPRYGVLVPRLSDEGVPFIRISDLNRLSQGDPPVACISPEQSVDYRRTVVVPGDVLTSVVGTLGTSAIVPDAARGANVARAVCLLRPGQGVPAWYLYGWLSTAEFLALAQRSTGAGTAQATLNMGDLAKFPVSVPSNSGLNAVARNVQRLFEQRDAGDSLMRRGLGLLRERRQALITAAVTGQFDVTTARSVA